MKVYKGNVYVSDGIGTIRVNWYVDEGETIDVGGEEMVKTFNLIMKRKKGEWHPSREEALAHIAGKLRAHAGVLAEKAVEVLA